MRRKKFYKSKKIEKRINFKSIKLITIFLIISFGLNHFYYDHIYILKDNIILDLLKSPLNIIAVISLFKPLVVFEDKPVLNVFELESLRKMKNEFEDTKYREEASI